MAALDFPASPTNGQEFTSGGVTWSYNGTKGYWTVITADNIMTTDTNQSVSGVKTIDNDVGLQFNHNGTGTASKLYRASGNGTRFEYYDNAFIFDGKEDDSWQIRNSADTAVFTVTPNATASSSNLNFTGGITATGLSTQASETTALTINGSNQIGTRELGTGAFATIADYAPLASPTFTGTVTVDALQAGDNEKIQLGASQDFELYHDSATGHSFIDELGPGFLKVRSNGTGIGLYKNSGGEETMATFVVDGSVTLYHDNVERIRTNAGGIKITGGVEETVYTNASVGTTFTLDPVNGTIQNLTLSASSTFSDSLLAGEYITLHILDGTAFTITWPTMEWIGGTAPTLDTTNETIINVWKSGSVLYGALVGVSS